MEKQAQLPTGNRQTKLENHTTAAMEELKEAQVEARQTKNELLENGTTPSSETQTLQDSQAKAWQEVMKRSGIPPRFTEAHISKNCSDLAAMNGKRKAYNAAKEFAKRGKLFQRDKTRFTLLFCGGLGTGKTWLSTAVFKEILFREKHGLWKKFYKFVREIQSCYNSSGAATVDTVLGRYQRAPLLMLDDFGDMQLSVETEDRRRLLYEVLDYRNDHLLPTLLTTNLSPDEISSQFGERTFQRVLEMSAIVEMSGDNMRL